MAADHDDSALPIWDRVRFRCTVCSAPMGTCDCWVGCHCGWFYGKGSECRNPEHKVKHSASREADHG